jgi:hypothetical protein
VVRSVGAPPREAEDLLRGSVVADDHVATSSEGGDVHEGRREPGADREGRPVPLEAPELDVATHVVGDPDVAPLSVVPDRVRGVGVVHTGDVHLPTGPGQDVPPGQDQLVVRSVDVEGVVPPVLVVDGHALDLVLVGVEGEVSDGPAVVGPVAPPASGALTNAAGVGAQEPDVLPPPHDHEAVMDTERGRRGGPHHAGRGRQSIEPGEAALTGGPEEESGRVGLELEEHARALGRGLRSLLEPDPGGGLGEES